MNDLPVVHQVVGLRREGETLLTFTCPLCGHADTAYDVSRDVKRDLIFSKWRFMFACGHTVQVGDTS